MNGILSRNVFFLAKFTTRIVENVQVLLSEVLLRFRRLLKSAVAQVFLGVRKPNMHNEWTHTFSQEVAALPRIVPLAIQRGNSVWM